MSRYSISEGHMVFSIPSFLDNSSAVKELFPLSEDRRKRCSGLSFSDFFGNKDGFLLSEQPWEL